MNENNNNYIKEVLKNSLFKYNFYNINLNLKKLFVF